MKETTVQIVTKEEFINCVKAYANSLMREIANKFESLSFLECNTLLKGASELVHLPQYTGINLLQGKGWKLLN
jgi:hypothetical protein